MKLDPRNMIAEATEILRLAGCESPQLDAEVLLAHALSCNRHELYTTSPRCQAPRGSLEIFSKYLERRKEREPVAYIVGNKEFWSITLKVTPDVLIPRPETEMVVEKGLNCLKNYHQVPGTLRILDLCTGSGAIAAALAKELPQAQFVVTDISAKALEVAKENLQFASPRVEFLQSNLFEKVSGLFDLIVSNPPYVPSAEIKTLMPEINLFEPHLALDGGIDGLDLISQIRHHAMRYLKQNGTLILENGSVVETWKN